MVSNHSLSALMLIRSAGLPVACLQLSGWHPEAALSAMAEARQQLSYAVQALQTAFDAALIALPEGPARSQCYAWRRRFFQQQSLPAAAENVLSEWPAYRQWQAAKAALAAAESAFESAWHSAFLHDGQQLQRWAADPAFQKGLFWASPDLHQQLPAFLNSDPAQWRKKQRRQALGLARYLFRAAVKTSPFSHFTTVSRFQGEGPSDDPFRGAARPVVSPNVAILYQMYQALCTVPAFYRALSLRLNPCLSGPAPVLEWIALEGEEERWQQAPADALLTRLLDWTGPAPRPFMEIKNWLADQTDASEAALERFIHQLTQHGCLEWIWPEAGLSANWAGNLYRYLGFLPSEAPIIAAAALLQWLRAAARVLPFQSPSEARQTLQDTREQLQQFFSGLGFLAPDIPGHQLFFEDVQRDLEVLLPETVLDHTIAALRAQWQLKTEVNLPENRSCIIGILEKNGGKMPFMDLARQWLALSDKSAMARKAALYRGKVGFFVQFFQENGQWKTVVNAITAGGRKMYARWMHCFPDVSWPGAEDQTPFPWHGWYNVNYQPVAASRVLLSPGSRTQISAGARTIRLADLQVGLHPTGTALYAGADETPFWLDDQGLEAPASKPPLMQLLHDAGTPWAGRQMFLLPRKPMETPVPGLWHLPRQEADGLVWQRAAWYFTPADVVFPEGISFYVWVQGIWQQAQLPEHFLGRMPQEKPQFYHIKSPFSVQMLEKTWRDGTGIFYLEEVLPTPEDAVMTHGSARYASEWCLEIDMNF